MTNLLSTIGNLWKDLVHPNDEPESGTTATAKPPAPSAAPSPSTIHPGLTDQQLVVLLTAAASAALETPVKVGRFRPLTAKEWSWTAQGRMDLHSHRLK